MTALLALAVLAGPGPLQLKLTPGTRAAYQVAVAQSMYSGDGKLTESSQSLTPFQLSVQAGNMLQITRGPVVLRGQSRGRAKTWTEKLDAGGTAGGRAPVNFFVCLPPAGAKVGQTWKAPFFGGPPLPAGMQATYKLATVSAKYATVEMKIQQTGTSTLKGSGKLFLRTADGFLDHGSAGFEISFVRPDPNDRKKMSVNSRVSLMYTIKAG